MTDRRDLARMHDAYLDPDRYLGHRACECDGEVGCSSPRCDARTLACSSCRGPLPSLPDRMETWEDTLSCDGTVKTYVGEYDEGLIAILGEEFRGKTYPIEVTSCGEEGPHEPHVDVMWSGVDEYRTCPSCGLENKVREY